MFRAVVGDVEMRGHVGQVAERIAIGVLVFHGEDEGI